MPRPLPQLDGVSHRQVEANGISIHLAEAGEGEPLVLLHGWPQHWYAWRKVIPALAEQYRVICPDLRGLGWTDAPRDGYEKENLASDLLGVLDALELERVRLMAHDWGAFAGFLACLRAPERFERYVALGMIHPWFRPPRNPAALARAAYQFVIIAPVLGPLTVRRVPAFISTILTKAGAVPGAIGEEARQSYIAQFAEGDRALATATLYRDFQLRELRPLAAGSYDDQRLTVPTLLIVGGEDPAVSLEALSGYEEHADDMRAEAIEGAGHWLAEEDPGALLERALPFLAGR